MKLVLQCPRRVDQQQAATGEAGRINQGGDADFGAQDFSDASITVVNKAEGRSTLEVFLHYFKLKNVDVKAQVVIGDNEQGVKTVAGNRNAIGYVSIGTAEYDATHLAAQTELDPVKRAALLIKCNDMVIEDVLRVVAIP